MPKAFAAATLVVAGHKVLRNVAAANADMHDMTDAADSAFSHPLHVGKHTLQHLVHKFAMQAMTLGGTQGGMQGSSTFGAIDELPREHGAALPFEITISCQLQQQSQRGLTDKVLGQVGKHLGRLQRQTFEAIVVLSEGLAQVDVASIVLEMRFQRAPACCLVTSRCLHCGHTVN